MIALSSPSPNVAQKTVLAISTGTTKIKEAIVKSLTLNASQEDLTKELNKIIADTVKEFDNAELQEDIRKSLIISARKWHYQLSQTYKILNTNLVNNAKNSGFHLGSFTVDLSSGNKVLEAFRPLLDTNAKGIPIIENYERQVKTAIKALSAEPPKVVKVTRKDGKEYVYTMSARNRAEIAARYEANLKDLQNLIAQGVKYVWTTSHPNCSKRCQPHQGKLYSLDPNDKHGRLDGRSYTYLGDVLELNNGNSIINGYNCRHRLVAYQEGSHPPNEYTLDEIKKEYAIDARQRNYENQIRQLKTEERLARANGNLEHAKQLRKQWRRLNKNYEIFSLKNNRAFYRWRTRVSDDEKDFTSAHKNAEYIEETIPEELQNEAENGIMDREDIYSEERKNNAYKFESRIEADNLLRDKTEKAWERMSTEEKKAMYDYTVDSTDINSTLRRGEYNSASYIGKTINDMTSAINKSTLDHDIWLKRKTSVSGLRKFLGLEPAHFNRLTPAQLNKMFKDVELLDDGFLSTSTATDAEYMGTGEGLDVTFEIYAPKGTKAMYLEPFSAYNANYGKKGLNWDGKSKPADDKGKTKVGTEAEVLLQRGYEYRIKEILKKGRKLTVIQEVILKEVK